jgi:hypothetical protein
VQHWALRIVLRSSDNGIANLNESLTCTYVYVSLHHLMTMYSYCGSLMAPPQPHSVNRKTTRLQINKIYCISSNVHSPIKVELPCANLCILPDIILNRNRTQIQTVQYEHEVVCDILYFLRTFIYQLIVSAESNYVKSH